MAKKLKDILDEAEDVTPVKETQEKSDDVVTDEDAQVLAQLGTSTMADSDRARMAVTYYLERLLKKDTIGNGAARATFAILKNATVTSHKDLANRVLSKYLDRFSPVFAEFKRREDQVKREVAEAAAKNVAEKEKVTA